MSAPVAMAEHMQIAPTPAAPLLDIRELVTQFDTRAGCARAVAGLDLNMHPGEIVGLVGESGSGKSVTGFSILGLVDPPGRIAGGSIRFRGRELVGADPETLRSLRGREIAMIFQDPMMTLNPVLRLDTQIVEAIAAHETVGRKAALQRARDALAQVGIPAPDERLRAYPHQLSGGMRQRVAIAIALLHRPALIIADEPTTALDVTIQAQIVYLMQRLCRESGTALLWITHDLAVIDGMADRVYVMYAGRVIENGPVREVLAQPAHPYTRGLIDSLPGNNVRGTPLRQIPGMMPSPLALPEGCAFRPRCNRSSERCLVVPPAIATGPARQACCFHPLVSPSETRHGR
jgi:peptide/nickel transport system ATP-binding protein